MPDPKRSALMSRIRGKDTKAEVVLRKALWATGLRYRLHARSPSGRPDIVFPGARVAVFVDGCFWHGCPQHYVRPRSRDEFWSEKLRQNVERDGRQTSELEGVGWSVVRVWEHEVFTDLTGVVGRVEGAVRGERTSHDERYQVIRVEPVDEAGDRERRFLRELRHPERQMVVEQERTTRKWKVPRPS